MELAKPWPLDATGGPVMTADEVQYRLCDGVDVYDRGAKTGHRRGVAVLQLDRPRPLPRPPEVWEARAREVLNPLPVRRRAALDEADQVLRMHRHLDRAVSDSSHARICLGAHIKVARRAANVVLQLKDIAVDA